MYGTCVCKEKKQIVKGILHLFHVNIHHKRLFASVKNKLLPFE